MNLLYLNCQGLGTTWTVSDLRKLLRRLVPKLVFLSETKKSKVEMEDLLPALGDYNGVFVHARGRSGGLSLLWNEEITV